MSQSEVEQLLASVDESGALAAGPGGDPGSGQGLISRHDFPQLTSFSADEMRKLRMRCESFVSSLAARLSVHLRLECALQMTKFETVRFQPLVDALSQPAYLTLFRGGTAGKHLPAGHPGASGPGHRGPRIGRPGGLAGRNPRPDPNRGQTGRQGGQRHPRRMVPYLGRHPPHAPAPASP